MKTSSATSPSAPWQLSVFIGWMGCSISYWLARETTDAQVPIKCRVISSIHFDEDHSVPYTIMMWYGMEALSALMALCEGDPPVMSGFPPRDSLPWKVNNVGLWSFGGFFYIFIVILNKLLNKQWRCWLFETPWGPIVTLINGEHMRNIYTEKYMADSRLAPNQWETLLQCNVLSHWLGSKPRINPDLDIRSNMFSDNGR